MSSNNTSVSEAEELKSYIADRLGQHEEKLDDILEKLSTLETTLQTVCSSLQPLIASFHPQPAAAPLDFSALVTKPKGKGLKINKKSICRLLEQHLPAIDKDIIRSSVDELDSTCLETCRESWNRSEYSRLTWKQIPMYEKRNMLETACFRAISYFPHLDILDKCDNLWPVAALMQPKWSSNTSKLRTSELDMDFNHVKNTHSASYYTAQTITMAYIGS
ncbi:hypothetical protein BDB01DRAFT_838136 [Pilobolus umbonatus]|nr:hypothetical protein BDB01DRAFT_838136 [Pilobolus umbonatus]